MELVESRVNHVPTALVVLIVAFLVLHFQPQEMIRDSAYWAKLVEQGDPRIWHPHHLIYMPINLVIYRGLEFFCADCSAIAAGQIHSAIWALVGAICMQYIGARITGKSLHGLWLALLMATSQMPWVFSMQPQAYMPLIGALSLVFTYLLRTRSNPFTWGSILVVAALYALTVLYHQAMVLISLPLAYYLLKIKHGEGLKAALMVLLISGAVVVGMYLCAAAYVMGELSPRSFVQYATFFGQVMADPKYFNSGNFTPHNVLVLLDSQFNVVQAPVWRLKEAVLALFGLGLISMVVWNCRQVLAKGRLYEERTFLLIVLFIFWGLTLWGNPLDDGWPTFILVPIFILTATALHDLQPVLDRLLGAFVGLFYIALFFFVFLGALRNLNERILPMHLERGQDFHRAELIASIVPPECTIYENKMLVYYNLYYFFSRETRDFWDVLTAAYFGSEQQKRNYFDSPDRSPCVAVNIDYLDPEYSVSGATGVSFPELWMGILKWMFGIKEISPELFQWRESEIRVTSGGGAYLIIHNRMTLRGPIERFWNGPIATLGQQAGRQQAYANWLMRACTYRGQDKDLKQLCAAADRKSVV